MAKSSRVVSVRMKLALIEEVEAAVARRNCVAFAPWITFNEWIVKAIKEKLGHLKRSKRKVERMNASNNSEKG